MTSRTPIYYLSVGTKTFNPGPYLVQFDGDGELVNIVGLEPPTGWSVDWLERMISDEQFSMIDEIWKRMDDELVVVHPHVPSSLAGAALLDRDSALCILMHSLGLHHAHERKEAALPILAQVLFLQGLGPTEDAIVQGMDRESD